MQSGMEKNECSYTVIKGQPSAEMLDEILVVYKAIFEDYKLEFFTSRIHEKEDLLIILCHSKDKLVGFKIGYKYNDNTFYSWVGGILPEYRRRGIAKKLAGKQEEIIKEKGYKKLRTKSMNSFKPMMILNLKNGFDVIQVYTNDSGQTKIVFEKVLGLNSQ